MHGFNALYVGASLGYIHEANFFSMTQQTHKSWADHLLLYVPSGALHVLFMCSCHTRKARFGFRLGETYCLP